MGLRGGWGKRVGVVAHQSGALQLVKRINWDSVRILMYHRFPRQNATDFDRQCRFLAAKYNVVSLAEAVHRLSRGAVTGDLAVITVDDGYADMFDVAFPVLQKYGLPATLFVTTGFVDRSCWMPGDRVRFHFAEAPNKVVTVTDDSGEEHVFGGSHGPGPVELRALLKRVSHPTRSRILSGLSGGEAPEAGVVERDEFRPCTWEQLRIMADARVTIGAHTVTHAILSRLGTEEEVQREILDSQARLEEGLQRKVDLFAYPNGLPEDVHEASVSCVRANFQGAVMATAGLNPPGSDVFQLRRLGCEPYMSVATLARMMAGPLRRMGPVQDPQRQQA